MDKSDFIRITSADSIRVTAKQEHQKKERDQKKKKGEGDEKDIRQEVLEGNELPPDLVELLQIELDIIKRQAETLEVRELDIRGLEVRHKTLDVRDEAVSDDTQTHHSSLITEPSTPNTQPSPLEQLLSLYQTFYQCVLNERDILNMDDIDFLGDIIRQKDDLLHHISETQKQIDFEELKKLSEKDEKKVKANQILADIHNVMNEIIKQTDENRVELHSVREKMKLEITKQDIGAKAVSKFAQTAQKSRFIDTKK